MVSYAYVEGIVKSLPIGYYAGRGVSVQCSKDAESSYYDLLEDAITISYPAIAKTMKNAASTNESIIRAIVYHELSHALLTPKDCKPNAIINIVEDERIETYFQGYYLGVDFKQTVRALNGWDGKTKADPNNPFSVFYHTIRYRDNDDLRKINVVENYILQLCKDKLKGESLEYYSKQLWEIITETPYEDAVEKFFGGEGQQVVEVECGEDEKERGQKNDKGAAKNKIKHFFKKNCITRDDDFTKSVAILFDSFNRKTGGGTAYQTYSGIINPRNAAREDCRFFDRLSTQTGNNKFGSLHLNLFLDCSGSFTYNVDATNQVLKALCEMEQKYNYFTFDVVACGVGQELLTKHDRAIHAEGGTELTADIVPLFNRLQKPQTANYNIIMYDGDAEPQKIAGKANAFGAFDRTNCFIISDMENKDYITKAVKNAKVVFTEQYVNDLKKNVLAALALALS